MLCIPFPTYPTSANNWHDVSIGNEALGKDRHSVKNVAFSSEIVVISVKNKQNCSVSVSSITCCELINESMSVNVVPSTSRVHSMINKEVTIN